jgi:signal transduction histidine kinase
MKPLKSGVLRYGLAVVCFAMTIMIAVVLRRYAIRIELGLLVTIVLVAVSWYGGRGPGLLALGLFEVVVITSAALGTGPQPLGWRFAFAQTNGLAILGILIWLVSGRREVEARLQRVNEELEGRVLERTAQLEAANKELESFSYSVSHDLRAPLRSIDGFSQALIEDYGDRLDETATGYLNRVRAATQRMGLLVDDLLNLSRVTRSEMRRQTVDLSSFAKAIAGELRRQSPERSAEFVIQDGIGASGDPALLRSVMENLLENAWKFTSKHNDSRIEFGSVRENGNMAYFVRDNGAGFDMAYADKLFGAFQRLHSVSEYKGTGIGLATVQRIIHRHGGRVWATGEVGKGATFYFTL